MNFKFNIQTKLFLILSGLTSVVLLVVLLAVNEVSSSRIRQDILDDFDQFQYFLHAQQSLRYSRLLESAILISENSTFKGNITTGDSETVTRSIQEFSDFTLVDILVVTDVDGVVLAWFGNQELHGTDISQYPGIQDALGNYDILVDDEYEIVEEPAWALLWQMDTQLFQTASVPIYIGDQIEGTLTLGTKLQDFEARELATGTSFEIAFFYDTAMLGASDSTFSAPDYEDILRTKRTEIPTLIDSLTASEPFEADIRGEKHLAFISPLGINDKAFFVASVPFASEFAALSSIQRNILFIGLLTILMILPIAVIIGRIFSNPINRLSSAMEQVSDGELDISLKATSKDEIGLLTNAFNEMIVGLRERFALSKYVGEHTLKMIQENDAPEKVKLGGSSEEFAILFTDIRGSTAKIEKSDPEQFVQKLNETLSCQAETILEHSGVIDKFVGDAVIALFTGEAAIERAIQASIDMQKRFNSKPSLNTFFDGIGIGLNFGSMILGNMGAMERMDYTVIGPEVNLCARLCSAAGSGDILIRKDLVTEFSLDKKFSFTDSASLELKGFSQQIDISKINYE